jgi:hypothetical protein
MPCRSFYWKKEDARLWKDAKATAKREGKHISNIIAEYLEQYVRLHEPGNPQQRLDTILKLGKAYHAPSPVCGFKDCMRDVVAVGVYLPRKEEYGLCQKHLAVAREDKKTWKILN